jgi:hypothetical protein
MPPGTSAPVDVERSLLASIKRNRHLASLTPEELKRTTAAARAKQRENLIRKIDPNSELSPDELAQRVRFAVRAQMAEKSLLSVKARKAQAEAARRAKKQAEIDAGLDLLGGAE